MSDDSVPVAPPARQSGRHEVGILFLDLVDSSVFASTLSLEEYAAYVGAFMEIVRVQSTFFFESYLQKKYLPGEHYQFQAVGDEVVVFLRTGRNFNDVYLLTLLASFLKAAWLGVSFNANRLEREMPPSEIAGGIHHGAVWGVWQGDRWSYTGYAINLAKRMESRSRTGSRYRIFLSDRAHQLVCSRVRNLLFEHRGVFEAKGILGQIGAGELAHSFCSPVSRLHPDLAAGLRTVLPLAACHTAHSSWIHDLTQNLGAAERGCVTAEAAAMARELLSHDPRNPVALYHLAQHQSACGQPDHARIILQRLTTFWPAFADGFWELGKVLARLGRVEDAAEAYRQAVILGAGEAGTELEKLLAPPLVSSGGQEPVRPPSEN